MLAIITDPGVGGTFLTWTINYLSGKTEYFSIRNQSVVELTSNPLTEKNAHAFVANQLYNIQELDQFLPVLINKNEDVYMHQFRTNTKEAVSKLCNQANKVVVLAMHPDQALYHCKSEPRHSINQAWNSKQKLSNADDIHNDFIDYFFTESKKRWEAEKLTDVWDQREFMALNFNHFEFDSILNYIPPDCVYHHINAVDLWTNFECSVHDLFDHLNIKIDQCRFRHWLRIYNQWKKNHSNRLKFVWYFEIIVSNILKGIDFDLQRFNLDLHQESAIQRALIYRHNLNVKTWQLTKFTNTKQLHNLLECNIHDLNVRLT